MLQLMELHGDSRSETLIVMSEACSGGSKRLNVAIVTTRKCVKEVFVGQHDVVLASALLSVLFSFCWHFC